MACMFVSPLNNIDELIVAPEGIRGKHELPIYIYIYISYDNKRDKRIWIGWRDKKGYIFLFILFLIFRYGYYSEIGMYFVEKI
jgi:hypothetical protein